MRVPFVDIKTFTFILLTFFLIQGVNLQSVQSPDLDGMYWDFHFNDLIDYFRVQKYASLSLDEKLLFIECLARTGKSSEALRKISLIPFEGPKIGEVYGCAGWVYFSLGHVEKAEDCWNKSLKMLGISHRSIFGKIMLLLFLKRYNDAENLFFQYLEEHPDKSQCFQIFLIGIEVLNATRNGNELYKWYLKRAEVIKKKDKLTHVNLKANARLYKKIKSKTFFEAITETDSVSVPLVEVDQNRFMLINFQPGKDRIFKILLDTGNAAGWMIHDRKLYDEMRIRIGGKIVASVGTEFTPLDGYRIYNERIDLDGIKILHLVGNYIPKPRPDFFDANLNPSFIQNRVVTLDGIQKKLILRSKKAFDQYLSIPRETRVAEIPWYGYEQVFVPVVVNRIHSGLGIIETGAEDIALKLDFARIVRMPLSPKMKYLSNGRVFRFFKAPVDVSLGSFQFQRSSAEVWSFDRFSRHLTGLKADVVFGPRVFSEKYIVSFDPFDRLVIIEGGSL